MDWRLEKHDEYIPEDWGVEPIRLVDDEGETVADNVAFYPHALTREHADAILAMQARLADPSPSPAPGVVEGKNRAQGMVRSMDQWRNMVPLAVMSGSMAQIEYALVDAKHDIEMLWCALASLSQPAKGEREGGGRDDG